MGRKMHSAAQHIIDASHVITIWKLSNHIAYGGTVMPIFNLLYAVNSEHGLPLCLLLFGVNPLRWLFRTLCDHAAQRTRLRSKSKPARPYI